jgi:endonuclease/exonuclease/phosphatase (EEP) superfamily protein YafD
MRSLRTQLARHGADILLVAAVLAAASPWLGRHSARADLLAQFLIQAALATAILLACLVIARQPGRSAIAGLCLVIQLATLQWPMMSAAASEGAGRVLFLNLWVQNPHPEEALRFVRASGADVVVLAEVTDSRRGLLEELADLYPHRVDCLDRPGCDLVLLSRKPPLGVRSRRDPESGAPFVEARVALGGRELTIAGTHLARPIGESSLGYQLAQVRYLARQLGETTGPKLLVGDLNAVSWAQVARELNDRAGLRPVKGSVEGSWPARLPWPLRIPIDNALGTAELDAAIRRVGPWLGSDHRPITIDLPAPVG